ncbi:MAG: hypothetical protein [Caudoviricetes sp.]|nr:MAG: hypothetical protein [Caudoviricetes sp.]
MCFSPKIKAPKIDTSQVRAIDPEPLTEQPKGILFGGDEDTGSQLSGRKDLKVKKEADKQTNMGMKKSIRSRAFN